MKKIFFYVGIAALIVGLSSCKKVKEGLNEYTIFDVPYNQTMDLPPSPFAISTVTKTMEIQPKLDSILNANHFKTSWVQHIYLKSFDIEVTAPQNGDLSFLKTVELYILADGLERKKIAYAEVIPDNVGKKLVLTTERTDIINYLLKDKIKLEIAVSTDKPILNQTTVNINSVFSLDIKILGI